MPPSSHRLSRALLLSVALHLGLGAWLWTRSEPEVPPAAPLQVPMTLQFVEVEVPRIPPRAPPQQPNAGVTTPSRPIPAPRSPRRSLTPLASATEPSVPQAFPGGVHPYFSTLGRSMLRHWDPEHLLAALGFEGTFASTLSAQKELARVMAERAEADASTGEPLDPHTLESERALRRKTKEQLRTTRSATVRVIQDERGRLLDVTVVSSSHDRYLDVVAADSVQRAAMSLPPLAHQVFQGHEIWSWWQLELIVSESPPEPTADLTFDTEMALTQLHLPLHQHLYKRVRLLEVRPSRQG